jgi:hypothetical protein
LCASVAKVLPNLLHCPPALMFHYFEKEPHSVPVNLDRL